MACCSSTCSTNVIDFTVGVGCFARALRATHKCCIGADARRGETHCSIALDSFNFLSFFFFFASFSSFSFFLFASLCFSSFSFIYFACVSFARFSFASRLSTIRNGTADSSRSVIDCLDALSNITCSCALDLACS